MRINSTLYYILKDHLGSASVVTNSSGNVVGEQRYYPFGETRLSPGSRFTDQLFTGQREMTGLGIYHFNARFYSPKLGRFLSADTIVPNPANPQDLNRYSYVRNNPLRYTDPTGNRPCGDGEKYDCDGRLNPTTPSKPVIDPPKPGGGGGNNGGNNGGGGGVVFSPTITSPLTPLDPISGGESCPAQYPNCDPLFHGELSNTQLNNINQDLINSQANLYHLSTGLAVVGAVLLLGAALIPPAAGPLAVIGTGLIIGGAYVNDEETQLTYLINEISEMETQATNSPNSTVETYVFRDTSLYAGLPSLTYEGSSTVYVANSITTIQVLNQFK